MKIQTETLKEVTPQEIIDGTSPREAHIALRWIPGPAYCGIHLSQRQSIFADASVDFPICERCRILWMQEKETP